MRVDRRCIAQLAASTMLGLALPQQSRAALVDEDVSVNIYGAVQGSVVSVLGYKGDAPSGVGSGFVWDDYGHIVTNYHVISKLEKTPQAVRVLLPDSGLPQSGAVVVAADAAQDIAVLRVVDGELAAALRPARIGTSADLKARV
jgi:S1-C subfamily serine protease